MKNLQEEFLTELKANEKLTVSGYADLYDKHTKLAIEEQTQNGADEHQAKAMGNYYTVAVLSNFVASENLLARILAKHEASKEE